MTGFQGRCGWLRPPKKAQRRLAAVSKTVTQVLLAGLNLLMIPF
jgi:hypothetical protein